MNGGLAQSRRKQFGIGRAKCSQCVEARSADLSSVRRAKIFFRVIFQLPRWVLVATCTFVICTALPLLSGFRAIRDRLTLDMEGKCMLRW